MILNQVDYRTKEENGKKYTASEYILGDDLYEVVKYSTKYSDGTFYSRISVSRNREHEYLPDIYFEDGVFGNNKKEFKIQTTAYGALAPDEILKVIDGYNTALEAVKILTKNFC